jgi:hypothetical protein
MMLVALLFGLSDISQAGLSWHLAVVGALLFSQCNLVWRNFPQASDLGCQSFDSPCCFISIKLAPLSKQGFGVTELMLSASAL